MAKISIDIEEIKENLGYIGYEISDLIVRENNGTNWQIKFHNSGAVVTIYDTNTKKNTVVNGKCEFEESQALKEIVDGLKCKEISIDPINSTIVSFVNSKEEKSNYDFKKEWCTKGKDGDLLHDIVCLANNIENVDAFLIIGVADNGEVVGVPFWRKSNEIYDFLRTKNFACGYPPEVELHKVYYKYHKLDVILIKSSPNVPFYLSETYRNVGTQIYTRVGDTNTPKNETANYKDVETLWGIHFAREKE